MTERQWHRYATLSQKILDQVGHPGKVPATCLERSFKVFEFQLTRSLRVPEDVLAYVDFPKRQVIVARDFSKRLEFPSSTRGVYHATLAHELGHVVLHRKRTHTTVRNPRWEREANQFAQVFLVPFHDLMGRTEVERIQAGALVTQGSLWKAVLDLADHYQVTGAFMVHLLAEYDVVEFDHQRRWIFPLVRYSRVLRPAA